ncbi:unnamed protein product [Angiostrongylus costaricensis]|uniref:CCHC-type domain-containing protein n=1 Tax=Angiostrongylus costaricensis TaxID=334426 RepID=A0A158PFQ7_ANGCS|nr:unnamed protein product [Angiostrongylus costaricensis]
MENCFERNLVKLTKKASVKKPSKKAVSEKRKRAKRQNQLGDETETEKKAGEHFVLELTQKEDKSLNVKSAPPNEDFNKKYEMVLEKLAFCQNASENGILCNDEEVSVVAISIYSACARENCLKVRERLSQEVESGNIEESVISVIMQKWRRRKREMAYQTCREKLVNMEGTLEDVKVTGYVYNGSKPGTASECLTHSQLMHFGERSVWCDYDTTINSSDQIFDPLNFENSFCSANIANEPRIVHDLVRRRKVKKRDAGDIIRRWKNTERRRVKRQITKQTWVKHCFPFASCFVCGQQGHLSRDCEKNSNGIYPDGGCCNVCSSTKHLKRDCPELAARKQKKDHCNVTVRTMSMMSSADEDYVPEEETSTKEIERKPKKKVVLFYICFTLPQSLTARVLTMEAVPPIGESRIDPNRRPTGGRPRNVGVRCCIESNPVERTPLESGALLSGVLLYKVDHIGGRSHSTALGGHRRVRLFIRSILRFVGFYLMRPGTPISRERPLLDHRFGPIRLCGR